MQINYKVSDLTQDDLSSFLSCALTGSFWAGVKFPKELEEQKDTIREENDSLEDILSKWLLKSPENKIIIYDIEEEDSESSISLENIRSAWEQVLTSNNGDWPALEDMDLMDADTILQVACFGEVVYG